MLGEKWKLTNSIILHRIRNTDINKSNREPIQYLNIILKNVKSFQLNLIRQKKTKSLNYFLILPIGD